ncbi:50S ribosomal protein L21 [Buchnera aphidicola]|uniref:Large ribosomal subunit protein bL21 n=1 Tax=Buchnera aphidicola (Cinara cf. splendens/pseudotsugae 3390) TaxID=2518980 RepID=A0A451CXV8_9GAMM|nr:50S ribosomal protein L21 [Buchnera aphidicola]VFP77826.1 50S ribosomal protein L21 [Buchnera aphidicola (Cinara cf. splendens/pseudotsugae 3390)]
MYVIFLDRNTQYKAKSGDIIRLEKININIGKTIIFEKIILLSDNAKISIGQPILNNIYVEGLIHQHGRDKKIKIIKFNRRKHYKKNQGHRQYYTDVKIKNITYKNSTL